MDAGAEQSLTARTWWARGSYPLKARDQHSPVAETTALPCGVAVCNGDSGPHLSCARCSEYPLDDLVSIGIEAAAMTEHAVVRVAEAVGPSVVRVENRRGAGRND